LKQTEGSTAPAASRTCGWAVGAVARSGEVLPAELRTMGCQQLLVVLLDAQLRSALECVRGKPAAPPLPLGIGATETETPRGSVPSQRATQIGVRLHTLAAFLLGLCCCHRLLSLLHTNGPGRRAPRRKRDATTWHGSYSSNTLISTLRNSTGWLSDCSEIDPSRNMTSPSLISFLASPSLGSS